ncbi:Glucan 1 [Phytophthora nicotianae]|uniref:Glucan 1 n=1 Tax=Phytophthora nicotianae TaxID=4792 RepID=A0A0W8DT47_PHYNI|nr:Glucan 1 [Phytophthora nicotianae]
MEERTSSFVELKNDTPKSKRNIMKQIKAKNYYTQQFQRIQQQTNMGRSLYFSNVAPTFYEDNYLSIAQETSVNRVRACFFIGFVGLTALYMNEWQSDKWSKSESKGRTDQDETTIIVLTFGVMLPSLLIGMLATFTSIGRKYLENITATVFVIVAAMMIAKKPVEKFKGPIIPLLILLIPIFGITRMRYIKSCCIGWSIFFSYLIVMMSVRKTLPEPDQFDSYTDISYQAINYGITAIGGMVSQYRQELLRRRNFCLQLPFSGTMDADAVEEIKTDKFSKKTLMHRWSLKFRHPEVEECFYRYWYLIDPFPYENPNSGSLHQGVFRTIRFAIWTLLLNQLVLLLQDIKFLEVKKDALVDDSDLTYALVLRFGVTVPLYFSAALFMYFLGKAFYARWVKEAEDAKNAALTRDSMVSVGVKNDVDNKSQVVTDPDGSEDTARMKLVVEAAQIKYATKDRVLDVLINKGGYVRSTQVFSSVVIACHVCCMGILLLAVSTGAKVDAYEKTHNTSPGQPKPVYYMGFLNAVLFAHRSGFRVRFIYATYTTFVVALGIIIAASSMSPAYYQQYAGYVSVIFLMGMMISYEEESLRRTFFVLKSIRTLEFEEWFGVVLRIQGWVKERFRKKLQDVRSNRSKEFDSTRKAEPVAPLINTSAQMAYASKLGMYSQMFNIIIAVADVITSSL